MKEKPISKLSQFVRGNSRLNTFREIAVSLIAIILALVIGAVIIFLMGESPIEAYGSLLRGSLGSMRDIANTLSKTIPLIFTGLAVSLGFRSNMFNIGAEGQLYFGAMVAIVVALALEDLNRWLLLPIIFIAGVSGGALVASIPAYFKAKFKINEVIVGIMLNYIVQHFTSFLVNGPLKADGTVAQTDMIGDNAKLTTLLPRTQLTSALFLVIIVVILAYIFLWKTRAGFKIRAVGINLTAAEAAGINGKWTMVFAMALSGGIAAMAGITEVLGKQYRFIEGFSPSYGFTGIAVAVLGRNHPFGVVISALLFGILNTGALRMSRETMVSSSMVIVIQSLVILFVSAPELIRFFSRRKKVT